jgi:hypothetical protein
MQSSQETRSWQRLVALAVVSGLTLLLYNYAVSHLISGPTFTGSLSSYIWFVVFSGFGLTCVAFIFSFADASMRNAVLRGIGVSAVLTGASLGLNFLFISSNSLASGPPIFPFLEIGVGGIAALWLRKWRVTQAATRHLPFEQPEASRFLYLALVYLLLAVPYFAAPGGYNTIRPLTSIPANSSGLPSDPDTRSKEIQKDSVFALNTSLSDVMSHSQGLLTLFAVAMLIGQARQASFQSPVRSEVQAPFPSGSDSLLLIVFMLSGIIFAVSCLALAPISVQASDSLQSVSLKAPMLLEHFHLYTLFIAFLPGIAFAWSGCLIAYRLYRAPELYFLSSFVLLLCSLGLSCASMRFALPGLLWIGLTALVIFVAQASIFYIRRKNWASRPWINPGETALQVALWGSISLALLGGTLYTLAIVMAYVSVADISYLVSWGEALNKGEPAPVERIVPLFAQNLGLSTFLIGPGLFTLCIFLSSLTSLVLSLIYFGAWGLFRWARLRGQSREMPVIVVQGESSL